MSEHQQQRDLTGKRTAAAPGRPPRNGGRRTATAAVEPLEFEPGTPPPAPPAAVVAATERTQERPSLRRSAWWWIRAAAITVTLFVGWQLLLVLQSWATALLTILLFVVFGGVVALAAAPVMHALERWARLPHLAAVLGSLLAVLFVVAGLLYLVAGPLAAEVTSLVRQGPSIIADIQRRIGDIERTLNAHGFSVGTGGGINGLLGSGPNQVASRLGAIVVTGVTGVITGVVDTIIVLVTAFWLLNDGPALRRGFVGTLPGRLRDNAEFALDATQVVIGGYVRAQLCLAFVVGTLAYLGCFGLGVPYPVVVGVAAGVFELVPLLGPFLGGAVGVALALTQSPVLALWTVAVFIGIHVIEGYVLAPRIQARFIQLHPLVAFLALISGIELDGLLGALFAVPAASLAAVFLRATIGDWRANRPEMFQASIQDAWLERRRRILLREFRLFRRPPHQAVAAWFRRVRGGEVPEEPLGPAEDDAVDPTAG